MGKVLSQSEVEALLNAADAEEMGDAGHNLLATSGRNVKLYDFRRPDKFSKDHIRALQNVHESYARVTTSSLTSYLRAPTNIHLVAIEQVVYDEYIEQVANPTTVHLVELQPLAGRIVVEMGMSLSLAMLDRIMGGAGMVGTRRAELTDIEFTLLRSLGATLITGLKEGWSNVADLQPILVDTALTADFVQAALPGDIAVLLVMEIQTLGLNGTISICIPHPVIEPLMDRLTTQAWFFSSRKTGTEDDRMRIEERLAQAELNLSVQLGTTSITIGELMDLGADDVIRLDRSADAELPIMAGDQARFSGRPGTVSGNRAIQVTNVVQTHDIETFDLP